MHNTWLRWDALVPRDIDAAVPRRVLKLGEHVGRTITLDAHRWIVVQYDQNGDPERYMVVLNPHKVPL